MATTDETLRPEGDLPESGNPEELKTPEEPTENPEGSVEPSAEKPEELGSEKGKFINALGEKNKKIDTLSKELIELKRKLKAAEEADLSDSERLQRQLQETAKENFKLKMEIFVNDLLKEHGLEDDPVAEICRTSPWAVPTVQRMLSDQPTWEETEDAVRAYLPGYLEQVAEKRSAKPATVEPIVEPTPSEEAPEPTAGDPQRTTTPVTKKRVWSRREIAKLTPREYAENKAEILKATAEGRIVD